ncbi:MAG: tRNA (adenosine(37)-N6)-threonylcarbamoyltransferase complex ATPase subunit type 1 TsaE [Ruminococcaceae bacterium]|nr:tRNA (adenosine(37)-N6)-threonylcarbamoyltransferase complex ATPase subunit type 1 TsaE [Oscillospiraceae bacterium]
MKMLPYPAFVALFGDLGAGKTAFVRGMVKSFDKDAVVTSPTYNIVNKYTSDKKNFYHFDMYRIADEDDLYSVGFYDYLDDAVVVTEWSENITYALPEDVIKVSILKTDVENERNIVVEF